MRLSDSAGDQEHTTGSLALSHTHTHTNAYSGGTAVVNMMHADSLTVKLYMFACRQRRPAPLSHAGHTRSLLFTSAVYSFLRCFSSPDAFLSCDGIFNVLCKSLVCLVVTENRKNSNTEAMHCMHTIKMVHCVPLPTQCNFILCRGE